MWASADICNRHKCKYGKSGEDKISSACQQGCLRRLTQLERPGCIKLIDSGSLGHPDSVLSGSFGSKIFGPGPEASAATWLHRSSLLGAKCDLRPHLIWKATTDMFTQGRLRFC